jgi:hypothetical protein
MDPNHQSHRYSSHNGFLEYRSLEIRWIILMKLAQMLYPIRYQRPDLFTHSDISTTIPTISTELVNSRSQAIFFSVYQTTAFSFGWFWCLEGRISVSA